MAAFHSTLGRPASFGTLGFHLVVNFRKTHPFSIRHVIARTIPVIALLMTKPALSVVGVFLIRAFAVLVVWPHEACIRFWARHSGMDIENVRHVEIPTRQVFLQWWVSLFWAVERSDAWFYLSKQKKRSNQRRRKTKIEYKLAISDSLESSDLPCIILVYKLLHFGNLSRSVRRRAYSSRFM